MRSDSRMVKRGTLNPLVFIVRNPDKHSNAGAVFKIKNYAGVFDCLPGSRQPSPMLRVTVGCFARRDTQNLRIDLVDLVQKSSSLGDGFPGQSRFGIIEMFY